MEHPEPVQTALLALEDLLVRQFRGLQTLVTLSKEERQALTRPQPERVMALVEEKEALLDELSQLEESRKVALEQLARQLGISPTQATLPAIRTRLDPATAQRLGHLADGVATLIQQAREVNQGNHTLAGTRIEWLDAAQAYLLSLIQPTASYGPPGMPARGWVPSVDIDQRA